MSKIKVNRLENTVSTDGGINIDTSGHVQVDGLQMPTAGALSNRNLIINGAMTVAQRSTAAVSNTAAFGANPAYASLDRWGFWASSAAAFTSQQVVDAPPGHYNSLQITATSAHVFGNAHGFTVTQRIEAQNLYGTEIGTAAAKTYTFTFWVKSSLTGTFSFYALNGAFTKSLLSDYTINVADTWEYKTISIPAPTDALFAGIGNARQLEVGFSLGAGSDFQTSTLGTWETNSFQIDSTTSTRFLETNGATIQFTGVQLEVGDRATPFEHESYGQTLAKCQRYYYKDPTSWYQSAIIDGNGTIAAVFVRFPTEMRTLPSVSHLVISALYWNPSGSGNYSVTPNGTNSYWGGNIMFGLANLSGCTNLGSNNDQMSGQFSTQIEYNAEL